MGDSPHSLGLRLARRTAVGKHSGESSSTSGWCGSSRCRGPSDRTTNAAGVRIGCRRRELVADSDTRTHATLPRRIVETYYRVRFGGHTLESPRDGIRGTAIGDAGSSVAANAETAAGAAMTNDEARMTKQIRMTNDER